MVFHISKRESKFLLMSSHNDNSNIYLIIYICTYNLLLILIYNWIAFKCFYPQSFSRFLQFLTKKVCQVVQSPFIDKEIEAWKDWLWTLSLQYDGLQWCVYLAVGADLLQTSWVTLGKSLNLSGSHRNWVNMSPSQKLPHC